MAKRFVVSGVLALMLGGVVVAVSPGSAAAMSGGAIEGVERRAVSVVGPSPAHAASSDFQCWWERVGDWSNCDGIQVPAPDLLALCDEPVLRAVDTQYIYGPGNVILGTLQLVYYKGGDERRCRLAAAAVAGVGCYGFVRRNSDQETYYTYDGSSIGSKTVSPPVYDANVTSFAWARCMYEGKNYDKRTINY